LVVTVMASASVLTPACFYATETHVGSWQFSPKEMFINDHLKKETCWLKIMDSCGLIHSAGLEVVRILLTG